MSDEPALPGSSAADADDEITRLRARVAALEERLALVQEVTQAGTFERDIATLRGHWDATMYRLFGLPPAPEGSLSPPYAEVVRRILPEDRKDTRFSASLKQPGLHRDLVRVRRDDGSVRQVQSVWRVIADAHGQASRVLGVNVDITDFYELAGQAAQLRLDFDAALRLAGVGRWRRRVGEDRVHIDDVGAGLVGLIPDPDGYAVAQVRTHLHPDDLPKLIEAGRQALAGHAPVDQTLRYRMPDGGWRHVLTRRVAERNADGVAVALTGVLLDDTERMLQAEQAEQARHERERAVAANLAKSRFLSRVSHELRTPLNAVLGFAQLLRSADEAADRTDAASRAQWVGHIHDAARHLQRLIDDVLDLSAIDAGELRLNLQPVDLQTFVQGLRPWLQIQAEALRVQLQWPSAVPGRVQADPVRLRQVLLNLLGNAVKFNRPGGRVWISVREAGQRVSLSVHDDGPGIDPQRLGELFQPFNRLGAERGEVPGSGVGLAVAKALVEAMGGEIGVHSEPGAGAVFTVSLPAAPVGA